MGWNIQRWTGSAWVEWAALLQTCREELNKSEYIEFSVINNATNRTLVETDWSIKLRWDTDDVYLGVVKGAEYKDDLLVVRAYNKVFEKMDEKPFTATYETPTAASTIFAAVCAAAGVTAGVCPGTLVAARFEKASCFNAMAFLARSVNKDYWSTLGTTANIGDRGVNHGGVFDPSDFVSGDFETGTFPQSTLQVNRRGVDRAKKRNHVWIKGTSFSGAPIWGEAKTIDWTPETDSAVVFVERKASTTGTLDAIATEKLRLLQLETSAAKVELKVDEGYFVNPGDYLDLNKPGLKLVGNFRIWRTTKTLGVIELEVDRPERLLENLLKETRDWEDLGIYPLPTPVTVASGSAFPTPSMVGEVFYRVDQNILYRCSSLGPPVTWEKVVQTSGEGSVLPSSGMKVGDVFYHTTENCLYRYTGTAWVHIHHLSSSGATNPSSGMKVGDFFYNTTDLVLYRYNGSAWVETLRVTDFGAFLPAAGRFVGDLYYSSLYEQTFYWIGDAWIPLATIARSGTTFPGYKVTGDVFFRTDQNIFYRYDGANWVFLATLHWYEVDEAPMSMWSGTTKEANYQASKGYEARRLSTASSGVMFYGPSRKVAAGEHYAIFSLRVSNNSSSSKVLKIDVYSSSWGGSMAALDIKPNMFDASNLFQEFSLRFWGYEDITDYEFRGIEFVNGICDVAADYIRIVPADTPIAPTNLSVPAAPSPTVGGQGASTATFSVNAYTWTDCETISPSVDGENWLLQVTLTNFSVGLGLDLRIYNTTDSEYYPNSSGVQQTLQSSDPAMAVYIITVPKNVNGKTLKVQVHSTVYIGTLHYRRYWHGHSQHYHVPAEGIGHPH